MKYFDSRNDVIRWGSEEIIIPYLSPADNKVHRYFPDFFVEYFDKEGNVKKEIMIYFLLLILTYLYLHILILIFI
mgnify:CR=1 FL=1